MHGYLKLTYQYFQHDSTKFIKLTIDKLDELKETCYQQVNFYLESQRNYLTYNQLDVQDNQSYVINTQNTH